MVARKVYKVIETSIQLPHHLSIIYTKSEDGIPVCSKIPDVLDFFKIMIYFLPAIKPPLGVNLPLTFFQGMSISQKVCWGKSLKWWVVCRINECHWNQNLNLLPNFFKQISPEWLITLGQRFKRHWFFSHWKVCWRLELTVVILSVPSTTKGRTIYQWGWSQLFGSSIWLDFECLSMSLMTHASKHLHTHAHCHPHIGTYAHRQFKHVQTRFVCISWQLVCHTHTHIHTQGPLICEQWKKP